MPTAVTNTITDSLSQQNMWNIVGEVLPVVLPLILFGFGFYMVKKVIRTARKGKPTL